MAWNHLDLFSGIGGFVLAARWAFGDEHKVLAFVEKEKCCQAVLRRLFDAEIFGDIKEFDGRAYRGAVDLLTGGFPCQPYSSTGHRKGAADDRALWPQMLRTIKECRPRWIVGENVAGFISMGLDECAADLEAEGYEVWPLVIPACAAQADHRRDRVWIIGHAKSGGLLPQPLHRKVSAEFQSAHRIELTQVSLIEQIQCGTDTGDNGDGHGLSGGMDRPRKTDSRYEPQTPDEIRLHMLGNAIDPYVAYEIIRAIREIDADKSRMKQRRKEARRK